MSCPLPLLVSAWLVITSEFMTCSQMLEPVLYLDLDSAATEQFLSEKYSFVFGAPQAQTIPQH